MKNRLIIIIALFIVLLFGSLVTYSFFNDKTVIYADQEIAQFVFETKKTNHIDINLFDFKPGDSEEYIFSISNKDTGLKSDVTINYQISISTYHFMPLELKLYRIDREEELVLNCDESYSRDEDNNLICNTPIQEMTYQKDSLDNYKLAVSFPEEYNSYEYADLVDYITVDIKSWQKTS